MTNIKKAVMSLANELHYREGLDRSEALKTAWKLIKQGTITTKIKGVMRGLRQKALDHLTRYRKEQIRIRLAGALNEYFQPVIYVIAEVIGKGECKIGYLPAELSKVMAAALRTGLIRAELDKVTGGWVIGQQLNYGANIKLELVA